MLQAEILVQYGMRNKAVERLQRIQELFPREEERNEDLQRLYLAAGVTPSYAGSAPLAVAATLCSCAQQLAPRRGRSGGGDAQRYSRGGDTRKLYHQGTAPAVLTTAVNEIGGALGSIALHGIDAHAGFGADGGAGVLRQRSEGRNPAAIKLVMCALQDVALAARRVSQSRLPMRRRLRSWRACVRFWRNWERRRCWRFR